MCFTVEMMRAIMDRGDTILVQRSSDDPGGGLYSIVPLDGAFGDCEGFQFIVTTSMMRRNRSTINLSANYIEDVCRLEETRRKVPCENHLGEIAFPKWIFYVE